VPRTKGLGRGWFYESYRHSLAAKGIRTGRKTIPSKKDTNKKLTENQLRQRMKKIEPMSKKSLLITPDSKKIPPTKDYNQIVVWEGINLRERDIPAFEKFFEKAGFRKPKIIGIVETEPDVDSDGNPIPGTGGRKDLLFYVNSKDIARFAIWRLPYRMKWWEDVLNNQGEIYPTYIKLKYPRQW